MALSHGFEATFMAKPYGQEAGSGTHVHISLLDAAGHNAFREPVAMHSPARACNKAVAGLLKRIPGSMALFAPNLNSFRRFQPGLYAPMAPTCGFDTHSVALHIPSGPPASRRIEHRVAGADVTPYLLLAVLLASLHHGLTR